MLIKFVRYFKGYLRIQISGNAVERFLNACAHKKILLWDLTPNMMHYNACIFIKDFKKIKPVLRKTKTKVIIVEKTGFPFFIQKFKNQRLFLAGIFFCVFLLYVFASFVWSIEISGNYKNTDETILSFLEKQNIKEGINRNRIDCHKISSEIRKEYEDIIWVSTSLEGTKLFINIKETEEPITNSTVETTMIAEPYDLIADVSGKISKVVMRNGISEINIGDYVTKGDLLVSGQIPIYDDAKNIIQYEYCIADADIWCKSTISYEDTVCRNYYNKEYLQVEKRIYTYIIRDRRIILGEKKHNYQNFEEITHYRKYGPFSYQAKIITPYHAIDTNYSDTELQKILTNNFQYYCDELEKKGVVILGNDVKIYTWSDKAKATGSITIEMPVGRIEKSKIIETGDHIDGNDGNNN